MSEQSLTSYNGIRSENIDRKHYTNSLIIEAKRVSLISDDDFNNIQAKMMEQLAEVINLYTLGESSSLKTDTAKRLMESMVYNIDTYLISLGDDSKALQLLVERKYSDFYGKGYLVNKKLFEEAKILYAKARLNRIRTEDKDYNKTLDKYFKFYLTEYNPKFSAHDKIYLSMKNFGISGAFHIDGSVKVLKRILEIGAGRQSDVILSGNPAENAFEEVSEQQN